MASAATSETLRLPLELISASCGFALDLGGSAFKLLYRSKEDYREGHPVTEADDGCGPIRLALFAREDIEGLIAHVTDQCDVTNQNGRLVYSAGMGGNLYKDILEERLKITLENIEEFSCLNKGLQWVLENLAADKIFHPLKEEVKVVARERYKEYSLLAETMMNLEEGVLEDLLAQRTEHMPSEPFMLVLCGSAFIMLKFEPEGNPEFLEAVVLGGRFFLGAMRLLTGVTDHDKLIDMMKTSDGRTVDMYTSEMTSSGTSDSYSKFNEVDINLFPFGKANYKPREEIKDGDIAHSFTSVLCINLTQMAHITANKFGLKKIYFCGNFVNSDFIKMIIASQMFVRNAMAPKEHRVTMEFLRFGGHLGALGAFLKHQEG